MEEFNWVRSFNELMATLNSRDSYFSGSQFIDVIREFDPYHADYGQYIKYRNEKSLSTSRKNYFYDILMAFKDDLRKRIIDRLCEVAKAMKESKQAEEEMHFEVSKEEIELPIQAVHEFTDQVLVEEPAMAAKAEADKPKSLDPVEESIANPIVFISYSWDNEDHSNWILKLSTKLFEMGIEVILDRYELQPGANMIHFMETSIPKADKVLVVFTPNYKAKAEKREGGVGYEYSILNQDLYHQVTNNKKYIPILKTDTFLESIPQYIQQLIAIDMTDPVRFDERFNELVLAIYNKPIIEKPVLGQRPF